MSRARTDAERETMRWAGRAFRRPWFAFCDAARRVVAGAPGERRIDPFFLPLPLDVRPIVWAMRRGATHLLLGPNASLFTVVVDDRGERILWAGVEREEGGVFVEYHVLTDRLAEPWADELASLLAADRMDDAFRLVFDFVKQDEALAHIDVGVLKVAHLAFFRALQTAWEQAGDGRNLPLFTAKALEAVRLIVANRWLRFAPAVNLGRLLDLLAPALAAASPANVALVQPLLARLPL